MINSFWTYVAGGNVSPPNSPQALRSRTISPNPRAHKPDYSLSYLQGQIDDLLSLTGRAESPRSSIPPSATDRLVEVIRSIAETLLWGDQNEEDSLMFDFFCEKGVMKVFVALLNSPTVLPSTSLFTGSLSSGNRQIKIQLLQTMSLLLLNVKKETSLYFLFSNNSINQLINNNNNLDFSDEEILSYYVSLMKSIALRLSSETIQFFINDKNPNYFPLFNQSIRFFDHHDRMVRIAVRTITLSTLKLFNSSSGLRKFLTDNSGGYFSLLACQLRDLWFLMDRELLADPLSTLPTIVDEMIDQLEYIADIERLGIGELTKILLDEKLSIYAVDTVLIKGLTRGGSGDSSPSGSTDGRDVASSPTLSLGVSLFVFAQLLEVFGINSVTSRICSALTKSSLRIEKEIKNVSSHLPLIIVVFGKLIPLATKEERLATSLQEFGLIPPKSIQLPILVAQSLARCIDAMSVRTLQITLFWLAEFFKDPNIDEEFKRPVRITVVDSFKTVATRLSTLIGNALLRAPAVRDTSNPVPDNSMDFTVIDNIEKAVMQCRRTPGKIAFTAEEFGRVSSDHNLLIRVNMDKKWSLPVTPVNTASIQSVELFISFLAFVKNEFQAEPFSIEKFYADLFELNNPDDPLVAINSPPTPPSEFIERESLATDRKASAELIEPLPENFSEGASIDLGKRDRISCTHITSNLGRSTRYLLFDSNRFILVAPDLTKPGFANVKFVEKLRNFKWIKVDREDQRILRLYATDDIREEQIGFEDLKRCHLALMHLETNRLEIRKRIYKHIETTVKGFVR